MLLITRLTVVTWKYEMPLSYLENWAFDQEYQVAVSVVKRLPALLWK